MKIVKSIFLVVIVVSVAFSAYTLKGQYELSKISPQIRNSFVPVDLDSEDSFKSAINTQLVSDLIKDRTVIGFGEATHGTKEFREAFSQMAKGLIRNGSINVVVLAERPFADSWKLNQFVLDSTFKYQPFLEDETYDDFARWLREYNKSKPAEDKVFLMGGDAAFPWGAATNALEFCYTHNIELLPATAEVLHEMARLAPDMVSKYEKIRPLTVALNSIIPLQQKVRDYANGKENLTLKELWYIQSINTLGSAIRFHYSGDATSNNSRDSIMFDNIQWIIRQKPNARALVYAHNAHIEKEEGLSKTANLPRLGWLLSKHYGEKYLTIATEVEEGVLWAGATNTIKVAQARDKIGNVIGKSVNQQSGLLVFNTEPLKNYFNEEHSITFGGGSRVEHTATASFYYSVKNYAKAFDAIFWVRSSSANFPIPPYVYSLVTSFTKERNPAFFSQDNKLTVSIDLNYKTLGNNRSWNDFPSFNILIFDKEKNLLSYHSEPLVGNSFDGEFALPANAESVMAYISGNRTETLNLNKLSINGNPMNKDVMFIGPHYSKTVGNDSKIKLSLKIPNE